MPQVELTLRIRSSGPAPAQAWFVPGAAPETWLDEIARWPVEHAEVRLIGIRERDGSSVSGALIIPPTADFSPGGRCVAFARIHGKVYVPAHAELFPAVSPAEANDLFAGDSLFVWAPGRGLTVIGPSEVCTPSELVTLPPQAPTRWNRAQPGVAFPIRPLAVLPRDVITAAIVLDGGRDDIGEQSDQIAKLPRSPTEPMSGIPGAVGRAAVNAAAKSVSGIGKVMAAIGRLTGRGSGASAAGKSHSGGALGEVADEMLRRVSQSLEAMRHKEIGRLLHMLDADPDQGLKFAIPFSGAGASHRGALPPGAKLGRRDANFDLGRLGGGGPADVWDMSWEYQQKLIGKYRELAAREVRLGRHRRAAYVYAELLGDLRSAATVLEQGGHFREAAVLYRDRLDDGEAAASCLERGELWNEAIDAYRELGRHEKVGDLLRHIGQDDAAAEAFHAAAREQLDKYDRLAAARIYVEKLRDANLAIDVLDEGWPDAPQATQCVHAGFTIRARLGLHQAARQRVDQLHGDAEQFARHAEVAELLAEVAAKYPNRSLQDHALALSRRIIAGRIRAASPGEAERLVATLGQLTPGDRLLPRDGRRYLDAATADRSPHLQAPSPALRSLQQLTRVKEAHLGLPGIWRAATAMAGEAFVAGVLDGRIVIARCDRSGLVDRNLRPWPKTSVLSDCELVLLPYGSSLSLLAIGHPPLPTVKLFSESAPHDPAITGGTPRGVGEVYGVAPGAMGRIWTLEMRRDPVLVCTAQDGGVIWTRSLLKTVDAPWDEAVRPLPMLAAHGGVLLGVGNVLVSAGRDDLAKVNIFASCIRSLIGSPGKVDGVAAVTLEVGACLIRPTGADVGQRFADDLQSPIAKITRGGMVIAADENKIEAYELETLAASHPKLTLRRETDHQDGRPIAILEDVSTHRFIVVYAGGAVTTYEL